MQATGSALQLLPAGFEIPGLVYLVPLVILVAGVGALLYVVEPPVTGWTVVALTPWMCLGAVLHVLLQQGAYPGWIAPLFGTPSVYLVTFVVAGLAWLVSDLVAEMRQRASIDQQLGTVGTGFAVTFAMYAVIIGIQSGGVTGSSLFWPVVGFVVAALVTGAAWLIVGLTFTDVATATGKSGVVVVLAHSLDAISTAIGVDVLGAGERTPLSAELIEFGAGLPTEPFLGTAWLFVLVKLLLAMFILVLFEEYVREEPRQANLLLAFVAAVGLGPGVHNLLLFAVTG